MAALNPAGRTPLGCKAIPITGWISDPGAGAVSAAFVPQIAGQHEHLLAAGSVYLDEIGSRLESFHRHPLSPVGCTVQYKPCMTFDIALLPVPLGRVDHNPLSIRGYHLTELNEDRAAQRRSWRVSAAGWIADVGTGRVVTVLVGKYAVKHNELFAEFMLVRWK